MDQGRIELLCKAGPDGASLGDCPFCHYVQMVLRYKVRMWVGRWVVCIMPTPLEKSVPCGL